MEDKANDAFPSVVVETTRVTDLQSLQAVEIAVSEEIARRTRIHVSPGQDFLVVSADRVRLRLREHEDRLHARASWQGPAGILASLVAALVAADFKDNLGLSSSTWEALFVVTTLGCAVFFVRAVVRAIRAWNRGDEIEALVSRLRE